MDLPETPLESEHARCCLLELPGPPPPRTPFLLVDFEVEPEHRRRGFGTRLARKVRQHVGPDAEVFLTSENDAMPFWETLADPVTAPDDELPAALLGALAEFGHSTLPRYALRKDLGPPPAE